ncbi:MAG: hypothetical protein DIJKHBIC_02463 [Thermoanaerobaculia bacterium]|nr:hypothetical protein [Thermoanaerobaculia bacterium]
MLTIYLAALAFGAVFIVASLVAGAGSGEGDHDAGASGEGVAGATAEDVAGDAAHHDEGMLPKVLSLRFWTYSLGAFGMTGTALSLLGTSPALHVPLSLAMGFGVGTVVCWVFRKLQKGSAAAPVDSSSVLGTEGEVVLPLLPGKVGKIRVRLANQDLEFLARSGEDAALETRKKVVVVRMENGVAEVRSAPWKD